MKLQLLASAAMAVHSTASSVSNDVSSADTHLRSFVIPDISFSEQAEDAIEAFEKDGSKMTKISSTQSNSNSKSNKRSVFEDMCDPDSTKPEQKNICEDIWFAMCAPDIEIFVDDELCDYIGFTYDVDWVDDYYGDSDSDSDSDISYKRDEHAGSKEGKKPSKSSNGFIQNMCHPEDTKAENEDICDDIEDTMCNSYDLYVDDLCKFFGFTDDEYYEEFKDLNYESSYDISYDISYDSEDRARKNLR